MRKCIRIEVAMTKRVTLNSVNIDTQSSFEGSETKLNEEYLIIPSHLAHKL